MIQYGSRPLYSHADLYAIADIHGEVDKLRNILDKLRAMIKPEDHLVFCGDLVDRGPDSPGVLKAVRDFKLFHPNTFVIEGNHEQMARSYAFGQSKVPCDYSWIANGGALVLEQFGVDWTIKTGAEDFRDVLAKENLIDFVQSFIPYYESEQVIATHAPLDLSMVHMYGGLDESKAAGLLDRLGDIIKWKFTAEEPRHLRIPEIQKFRICGHQYSFNKRARVFKECVFLDTGCGCKSDAPLALFHYPSKKIIYSDAEKPGEISL